MKTFEDLHHQTVQPARWGDPKSSGKPYPTRYTPNSTPRKKNLPRAARRTVLSQLRLRCCKAPNSFQNLLDPSTPTTCPECDTGETHATQHLYRCADLIFYYVTLLHFKTKLRKSRGFHSVD